MRRTDCENCGHYPVSLDSTDLAGILDGGECPKCEYYVTRYTAEFHDAADWM